MDIRGRSVLILGSDGLAGQAVAPRLLRERPARMILLSPRREEAGAALAPEVGKLAGWIFATEEHGARMK